MDRVISKPFIKEALFLLNFCGLNPLKQNVKNKLAAAVCIILILHIDIEVIMHLIIDWEQFGGVEEIQEPVIGLITAFQVTLKFFSSVANMKKQANLLDKMAHFWPVEKYGEKVKNEIDATIATIRNALKLMVVALLCMQLVYWIQTVVSSNGMLPLITYHPTDRHSSPANKIEFFIQIWVTMYCAIIIIGFDLLFAAFTLYIMFELKQIKQGYLSVKVNPDVEDDQKKSMKEIGKVVKQHNLIFECIGDVNDIYSTILLNQLLTSTIAMCTAMLPVFTNATNDPKVLLLNVFNMATFLGQLFVYCLIGTNLTSHCGSIADGLYETDWWMKTQPQFRRAVVIIMQRSQQLEEIYAGRTFGLNFETFTSTVNAASSILMMIRTIYFNKKTK